MQRVVQFSCDTSDVGQRLDEFLTARLAGLSRMRIARACAEGACAVNGARGAGGQKLCAGDRVAVLIDDEEQTAMTPAALPLVIVYEDDQLLVVDKPAGLLVHPTRASKTGTLANALAYHVNRWRMAEFGLRMRDDTLPAANPHSAIHNPPSFIRPGLVHRLDRATSGLLVVAKTQRALSILSRHFHERRVEKRYLALVGGRVAADVCEIDAPIGRDAAARPQWRVLATGRPALTRLRVLERADAATLVELEPVTGRTNQLRIHCAHAGHAILGDEWYAGARAEVEQPRAARLCLHAARLAFHHPSGGRWLEFASPLPAEIATAFASTTRA